MFKKILQGFICLLITASLSLCFVGCGVKPPKNAEYYYSFTDALERKIVLDKKPERVAALIGSFADVWMLSGGELVATAEDAWEDFGLDTHALNIGGAHSPSVEKLLSANPDFVIASASTAANIEIKETLTAAGITVAYFDVDNLDDYLKMLKICTDITGRKDLYEKNGSDIEEKVEKIKAEFNNKNIPQEKRTVLLLRASTGSVKAKDSKGTVLGEMLYSIGCINIADSEKGLLENLSVESIIKNEPYHIFVVTMGDEVKAKENLETLITDNPAWAEILAVKENRLHIMNRRLYNLKPNDEWAVAYEKLCEIF